jgi:DNA-binding beta-propeller fold protein YncE
MRSQTLLAFSAVAATALLTSSCETDANCPTCGTTKNGAYAAISTIMVPRSSPYGKPFQSWDIVVHDPATRQLYVTDRSHASIAVYETVTDTAIGTVRKGFVGAVCCEPDRASNFNELSGPNAVIVTDSGPGNLGVLWVSDGDSMLKVFDLNKDIQPVKHLDGTFTQTFGTVRTGISFTDIDKCSRSGLSDPAVCGDMRADEMAYDPDDHRIIVTNGDTPGPAPFLTLVDTKDPKCTLAGEGISCVKAQIFFDGAGNGLTTGCPTSDVSGVVTRGVACWHGPNAQNGLGGSLYNPVTRKFLLSVPQVGKDPQNGEVAEIDPKTGQVTNDFLLKGLGCQVAGLALGPSQNLLVACANREGQQFPPSTVIMNATTGAIIKVIYDVGRVDEAWYNDGDKRFYLAARDMANGSVLGIIDALTNNWLQNVPTGGNAHALAADPFNNHVYIPFGPNARCGQFSAEGCIAVYAAQ